MTYAVPGPIRTNIVSSTSVGGIDSPFTRTRAVLDMMKGWEIMKAVTEGTEYLRENSEAFLPLEPREDYDAYLARVNRSVFSPFTQRLIRAATGLVLRKPIKLIGDPYWTEMFKMDVDGCKSDLDEYARSDALSDYHEFDNSKFVNYLESKGFHVAKNNFSNYPTSIQSIPATMNMRYINFLSDEIGTEVRNVKPLNEKNYGLYPNNQVMKNFK